jgi:putrescine transport system substrate-binding protein
MKPIARAIATARHLGSALCLLGGLASAGLAHAQSPAPSGQQVLNILNWADYIAPDTIKNFEKETGIKVRYDNFDANETLHARLVADKTGYDLVVPGAHFAKLQIDGQLLRPLDRSKLSNWKHLDAALLKKLDTVDPGNQHLVTWLWGFVTVGINPDKVKATLGDLPMPANPLDLLLDPRYAERLKRCGTHMLDSASEVIPVAMLYAGRPGWSNTAADYNAARDVLMKVRPHITRINSPGPINDLANGKICVSLGYSGDFLIANQRAAENKTGQKIEALIPPRGATMFMDTMAIPKDAKNVDNAHKFIDYILRPQVHASLTNTVFYGNPNAASRAFVKPEIASNPVVFPSAADVDKLAFPTPLNNDGRRAQTRLFQSFKSGK